MPLSRGGFFFHADGPVCQPLLSSHSSSAGDTRNGSVTFTVCLCKDAQDALPHLL